MELICCLDFFLRTVFAVLKRLTARAFLCFNVILSVTVIFTVVKKVF